MTDMKEIARRQPINRTAARVTQPGPKGNESIKRIVAVCSSTPLPLRALPRDAPQLVGRTFGSLTVVGLFDNIRRSSNAQWVCRCVCGYYVIRLAKSIRNPKNAIDCCERCRQVQYLRRRSEFDQLGYNPDEQGK